MLSRPHGAAVARARVGERARVSGRTANRVRQLLVMELRLERARTTRDLDLRAAVRPDELLGRLRDAARLELEDHLTFEVERDQEHPDIEADGLRCEGQRFRVNAALAGRRYGDTFGVDVVVGEPIVGEPQPIDGDDLTPSSVYPCPSSPRSRSRRMRSPPPCRRRHRPGSRCTHGWRPRMACPGVRSPS